MPSVKVSLMKINNLYPRRTFIICTTAFLSAFITFVVYLPVLQNGFVNWDDDVYVYGNNNIRSINFSFLKWMFSAEANPTWHPLTLLSLATDYSTWGLNPFGYHLTNLILHAFNTFFVFILTVRLIENNKTSERENRHCKKTVTAGFVTSILFGIHPLHVESVAWISERKDVLCAFFFLLTLIAYFKYISADLQIKKFGYYIGCFIFFILALMSKPMAVSLPIVLLLLDIYPLNRLRETGLKILLLEKLPFVLLSGLTALMAAWSQNLGGTLATFETHPIKVRLLVAVRSYIIYLVKMVFPFNLAPYYPYPDPLRISLLNSQYLGPLILLFLIISFCVYQIKCKKIFFAAVWFYYLLTLLPVIGFVQVAEHAAADRYTYLPSIGPFLLSGLGIGYLLEGSAGKQRTLIMALIALLLGILSIETINQIAIWKDSISLWSHEIKIFPNELRAYNNRGLAYSDRGFYEKAVEDLNRAIKIYPHQKTYNNRAIVNYRLGHYEEAISDFTKAIEFEPKRASAYYNRGNVYCRQGNYKLALRDYSIAIELNPKYARAYYERGKAHKILGNSNEAINDYNAAVMLDPRLRNLN